MTTTKSTTVSAPGKVLLAGGYLVLESPNVGLVIATDARFYCTVKATTEEDRGSTTTTGILVRSPQFHSTWEYVLERNEEEGFVQLISSSENESENAFVEKTLRVTLAYLISTSKGTCMPSSLDITIRADNDFYSVIPHLKARKWEATPENVTRLPMFLPCPTNPETGKAIVNKTGLGSSAALVTSLVGALVELLSSADSKELDKQMCFHLAQICHCHAQGKVGSGFDVSSAVHGSHVYQRFPKCTLPDLLSSLERHGNTVSDSTVQVLQRLVESSSWGGGVVEGVALPSGLTILLGDVCGGSESPSMARKVLAWKANPESSDRDVWNQLAELNPQVVDTIKSIGSSISVEECSSSAATTWQDICPTLYKLHTLLQEMRQSLKRMGDAVGVPIEPNEQTSLADATMALDGVVACVVPGAGGYDALACLCVDHPSVRERIGKLWQEWEQQQQESGPEERAVVCPLGARTVPFGEGLRVEKGFESNRKQ